MLEISVRCLLQQLPYHDHYDWYKLENQCAKWIFVNNIFLIRNS